MFNYFINTDYYNKLPDDCTRKIYTKFIEQLLNDKIPFCSLCYNRYHIDSSSYYVDGAGYICAKCF